MKNVIDFQKEKARIIKNRVISNSQKTLEYEKKKISNEIYLLSKLYEEGTISDVDIIVSFKGIECYYGGKSKNELYLLKERIDNVQKEIKFE